MAGFYQPLGRKGFYTGETQNVDGTSWTWIPTRDRWEMSGGTAFNTQLEKTPAQVANELRGQGKSEQEVKQEVKKQIDVLTNPSANYQFGATVKTGLGIETTDSQSELNQQKTILNNLKTGNLSKEARVYAEDEGIIEDAVNFVNKFDPDYDTSSIIKPKPTPTPPPPPPPPLPKPPLPPIKPIKIDNVVVADYKSLLHYINQYPATNSSVKNAADTSINSYYTTDNVRGHYENIEGVTPAAAQLYGATVVGGTFFSFLLLVDGAPYISPILRSKIDQAIDDKNPYFELSVPVVNISTASIKPYGSSLFLAEEEYAFNAPTSTIDEIEKIIQHIDWTCKKTDLEEPLRKGDGQIGAYDDVAVVKARLNLDEVIASANKPPKIRWRQFS
jgi:hypothetical protein